MIALARADARRFRAAARRCFPSGRPRGPAPPVRVAVSGETVTLAAHLGEVVVALTIPAAPVQAEAVTLTLAAFDAFDGPGAGVVTLEAGRDGAIVARWDGGPDSGQATFDPVDVDLAWPDGPDRLAPQSPEFLTAMHEAGRTAARDTGKYATTRVQLRGKAGQVIGTDGKQALVHGGFPLPFAADVLVPAVPVFGSKELAGQSEVGVGVTGDWVCAAAGPWRVWLLADREGRFPDVLGAVPRARGTHVEIADRDARDLLAALSRLPGAGDMSRPVTLDLGPRVVVRARDEGDGPAAQVPLSDSAATGPPVRVALDRDHLGRALTLGFREFRVASPERPVTARTGDRLYLFAALDPSGAIPPDSLPVTPIPPRRRNVPSRETLPPDRNGHADPPPPEDLVDPLAEAEGLRAALAEAAARAARLVATLKQFRRERRALQSAWSSLKQLNLGP